MISDHGDMSYKLELVLVLTVLTGIIKSSQPLPQIQSKGQTVSAFYDQSSTAYFSPPKLVISPAVPSQMQLVHPLINYMNPFKYTEPAYMSPTVILPLTTSTRAPYLGYDPVKSSQIIRAVQRGKHIPILRMASDFNHDGTFNYAFDTGNGISTQTVGIVKDIGNDRQAQLMHGVYSYTSPDGTPITTNWYADETGFHAQGAHLPTPPPIPEVIANSLGYTKYSQPRVLIPA